MSLSQKEVQELKEQFQLFDTDGSGYISWKELGHMLRALGSNPTEAELKKMISKHDKDGSRGLDFTEYLKMVTPHIQAQ